MLISSQAILGKNLEIALMGKKFKEICHSEHLLSLTAEG